MKYQLSFTSWYLNVERISQLINSKALMKHLLILNGYSGVSFVGTPQEISRSYIKQALEEWLHSNRIPSLGELIVSNSSLKNGDLFTIYQDFYCKGLKKYNDPRKPIPRDAVAEIHNKLKFDPEFKVRILYNPIHLIHGSSWSKLSGYTRLFCFCYIDKLENKNIIARPYIIADVHSDWELDTPSTWDGYNYGEIHPSSIDQFVKIKDTYSKKPPDISVLKSIPEESIKKAFAEIINEDNVPKDWGGEKSDLFSTNLSVNNRFMPTAFLFKGPAKFSPMKMTHLGKNGDQIERLFSEPADFMILQHCHKITNPVRSTMKAYACRVHDLKYFSIIDGYDTHRILESYKKCGIIKV